MKSKEDHPGVYIPPPVFFIGTFLLSIALQWMMPLSKTFLLTSTSKIIGAVILVAASVFTIPALRQFIKSKNTVVTIKPASSLQTSGVYGLSRNPMYLSLLLVYAGFTLLVGNWWNFILLPFLIILMQTYVISREEKYLQRRFGDKYSSYKSKVRRWL